MGCQLIARLLAGATLLALVCAACRHTPERVAGEGQGAAEVAVQATNASARAAENLPRAQVPPPQGQEQLFPPGMFKFVNAPVRQVLEIYRAFSGLELTIDPGVDRGAGRVSLQVDRPLTRQEAIIMLERTLLAQAGVRISRLGPKSALVTHVEGNLR